MVSHHDEARFSPQEATKTAKEAENVGNRLFGKS
jgi:hypothetical protein